MLTKCENCGFYVSSFEKKCPNCGRSVSLQKVADGYLQIAKKPAFFALFFSLILVFPATFFLFGDFYSFIQLTISVTLLYLIIFFTLFLIQLKRHNISTVEEIVEPLSSLRGKQSLIEKRISELDKRSQKIDAVLDKIKETEGGNLQEVRQKLLAAREIVISQFARYELQAKKIELVRLQNDVSPYLFALHRLNEFETENGLATIEYSKQEINKIRQNLTNYIAIEFPAGTLPEKLSFLAQLRETEDSCEKLREALLSRQAARALQNISPIEENLKLPNAKEIAHAAETFSIQTNLTDFGDSFEELEREYRRLQTESEVSQSLLNV